MPDHAETSPDPAKFDFSSFPEDTLFLDRRTLPERRDYPRVVAEAPALPKERRARKERRRRVDPTTFEKQYSDDEIEFMNSIQAFKGRTGKSFPSHGDILNVALGLGYRQFLADAPTDEEPSREAEPAISA